MSNRKEASPDKEQETLLTFLEQTRKGEYAKIEESSLPYARIKFQRDVAYYEDEYLYSVS